MSLRSAAMLALSLGIATSMPAADSAAQTGGSTGVTIYRCVDSRGQLVALRDSPCRNGERQETVQMQRPQDPPPRTATTAAPAAPSNAAPTTEVRIVTVQAPQPVYECTSPDGETYTSDSSEGTERWVPLWVAGVPAWRYPRPRPPPRPATGPASSPPGPGPRPPGADVVVPAGGTWVRDACVRVPQDEVCRRLSDRRFEILRIYHAAMPSGRAELDEEQRMIDARMDNDCRGF